MARSGSSAAKPAAAKGKAAVTKAKGKAPSAAAKGKGNAAPAASKRKKGSASASASPLKTDAAASPSKEGRRDYSAFVLNKHRYNVGDGVLVQSSGSGADYIGAIVKIQASPSDHKNVLLTVNWFYRPEDINGGRRPYHGRAELLQSEHRDTVHVGTVNGPCKIFKFEEYQATEDKILEEAEDEDNVFYYREQYDYKKGVIKTKLHLYCICRKPQNPDDLMIQCDACEDWFHSECIELSSNDEKSQSWVCPNCMKKGIKLA